MRNSVVIVAFVAVAVLFVAQVQAQTPANGTSVLVQVESQTPVEQVPAVQAPPVQYVVPTQVTTASTPVWMIKRRFFGFGYRAKPAWLHNSLLAPVAVSPAVVAPPPIVVPPPAVQLPQPVIRYTPSVEWR